VGAERLEALAPNIQVRWFDSPHDIPVYMPAEVAAEIERVARLASGGLASEAAAG
jgi:hypothetical protein